MSLFRCWYCHNDDDPGCDCGACGLAGGHGQPWCVSHGCRACGDRRAWPWRTVFWKGLGYAIGDRLIPLRIWWARRQGRGVRL